jgi:hypothetical protein
MYKIKTFGFFAVAFLLAGCGDDDGLYAPARSTEVDNSPYLPVPPYVNPRTAVLVNSPDGGVGLSDADTDAYNGTILYSNLTGCQQVPEVDTPATGYAIVKVNQQQTEVHVTLKVFQLSGTTKAQVHLGTPGVNGPVIFNLASNAFTSPLVTTLRAKDLIKQPSKGINTFANAIGYIISKEAYISVYTSSYPTGHLRGQIGGTDTCPTDPPPLS